MSPRGSCKDFGQSEAARLLEISSSLHALITDLINTKNMRLAIFLLPFRCYLACNARLRWDNPCMLHHYKHQHTSSFTFTG